MKNYEITSGGKKVHIRFTNYWLNKLKKKDILV